MEAYTGELAALGSAFLWAVASVVYRGLGDSIPPLELNLTKGLLALAMLGLSLLLVGDPAAEIGPLALGLLLLSGIVGIGLGDTAFFESMNHLGARRTLLLGMLAPPLAALLALVFLKETLTPGAWLGVFVTVAGVAWVVTERTTGATVSSPHLLRGVVFGLLAGLAQAGGAVLTHAALYGTHISALWGAFLRLTAGSVLLLAWMALARRPFGRWLRGGQAQQIGSRLLFAVTAGTFLAMWLQQTSLKFAPAGIAQTLFATSPLFVLPFAVRAGEAISVRAVLGAVVGLIGVGLLFGLG